MTVTELDVQVFRAAHNALRTGALLPVMVALSAIGGGWGSLTVVPLLTASRTRRLGATLAVVLATNAVLVFVLKRLFARVRPVNAFADIQAHAFNVPTDFSFPSGHASGSFCFAVFMAIVIVKTASAASSARSRLLRWSCAALLVLVAVGVGLSRIALGMHFPGDVLAGACLGTIVAVVGASMYLRRDRVATGTGTATTS